MSIAEVKIPVSNLQPGMYVARLDKPWLETPYKIQGFLLREQKDIDRLKNHCKFVYIDAEKSSKAFETNSKGSKQLLTDEEQKHLLINAKPRKFPEKSRLKDELKVAHVEHEALGNTIKSIIEKTVKNNKLDLTSIQKAVAPMVDSVIRNPDAFTWLTMMKRRDDYAYNHSISSAIWAAAFGRNLGLPIMDIKAVAMGGLLLDIGKVKLPEKLISNPNAYNQVEFNLVKRHVDYGLDIIRSIDGITDDVVQMVATHHERHNGSGYPNGLADNNIPLFGKMAGIIDCYDAIISDRPHIKALSPHDAVKKLYDWSGSDFQPELIEQFIQIVGIYPVGTLIELSDGRIGVIVALHKVRRLRPKVMLILDKNRQLYQKYEIIDLFNIEEGEDGRPLNIIKTTNPGKYGLDPSQFYLLGKA